MIDRAELNRICNALKKLVGEDQGAFMLFCCSPNEDDAGEDTQIRSSGPVSRQMGLLRIGHGFQDSYLTKLVNEQITKLPNEPD